MMNQTIATSLRGFVPVAFMPTSAPAKPPKRAKTTQTFQHCLDGVDLICELDFERASGDGWHEPREPANAWLCNAFDGEKDIVDELTEGEKNQIETAFLEQKEDF